MTAIGIRRAAGIVALAAAIAAAVRAVRPRSAPGVRGDRREWLRSLATRRFNPLVTRLGLVGGRRSPWGYIEQVGRKSGRVYRTPVLPRLIGDFAYIPLPYGPNVHWARNVRAAGTCRLQVHETVYELEEPADITAAEHPGVPEVLRPALERRGRRYMRLHVLSARPGRLDERATPKPAPAEPAGAPPPAGERLPTEAPPSAGIAVPVRARSRAAALATPAPAPVPLRRRTSG